VELSEFDIYYEPRGPIKGQVYADFVVELVSEGTHSDLGDFQWILSVDRSSNQQGSSVGVVLEGPNGLLIKQSLKFVFKAINNQVEYEALIEGMLLAQELGARSLLVKSDSLLVTEQVTGRYQAKDPKLVAYHQFELIHVPREKNSRVDMLAKLASSRKRNRQRSVIQETLKSLRTVGDIPQRQAKRRSRR